jgi:hypothetical protein
MEIYLYNGEEQFGPYSEAEVRQYVAAGNVTSNFHYYAAGATTNWEPILGSFLMPVVEQAPPSVTETEATIHENETKADHDEQGQVVADPLEETIARIKTRLASNVAEKQGLLRGLLSHKKRRINEYKDVMVCFSEGGKEYGPYELNKALHYENIETAAHIRLASSSKRFDFKAMKSMWEEALASEKQCTELSKLGIEFDPSALNHLEAKKAIDEIRDAKPPTPKMRKQLKELGVDKSKGLTRSQAKKLIDEKLTFERLAELKIKNPQDLSLEEAKRLVAKKEASLEKAEEKKRKKQLIEDLQNSGVVLKLPISDEELEEIESCGPPEPSQIQRYNAFMEQFSKFGLKLKIYGEKEPKNHNNSSIDEAINMMDEVLHDCRLHDDELLGGMIESDDYHFYEMSRNPTPHEMFEIHKTIAKRLMDENWDGDSSKLRSLIKLVCKDIKITKN